MLFLLETRILLYGIIFAGMIGIISRIRLSFVCKNLVKEVENVGSSSHELLMLIKKKYENSILLNRGINNTQVFVEKYLRKYQVGKITLKSLGAINYEMMLCALILGCVGGVGAFFYGMSMEMIVLHPAAAVLIVMLLLFCETFLEIESRLEYIRLSVVDYLENTMQNRVTLLEEIPEKSHREAAAVQEEFPIDFTWNSPEDEALVRQVVEEYFS